MESLIKRKSDGKILELVRRVEVGPRRRPRISYHVLDEAGKPQVLTPDEVEETVPDQERYAHRALTVYKPCRVCGIRDKVGMPLECDREDCPKEPIA